MTLAVGLRMRAFALLLIAPLIQATEARQDSSESSPATSRRLISAPPECDPTGTYCAIPLDDGGVELLELETGKVVRLAGAGRGRVVGVTFDSVGEALAIRSRTGRACIRSVPEGRTIAYLPDETQGTGWWELEFSRDGSRVLTWGGSRTARLWELESGSLVASLEHETYSIRYAMWSPSGDEILTAGWDGVRVWEAETGLPRHSPLNSAPSTNHLAFDPRGGRIALGCRDSRVRILDARSGEQLLEFEFERFWPDKEVEVWTVRFHPDGAGMLTTSDSVANAHYWSLDDDGAELEWNRSCGGGPSGYGARFAKASTWVSLSAHGCHQPSELVHAATGRTLFRSKLGDGTWLTATPDGSRIVDASREELRVYEGTRFGLLYAR